MEEAALNKIIRLIQAHSGLKFNDSNMSTLLDCLISRIDQTKMKNLAEYFEFLKSGSRDSEPEWQELSKILTIGETYFFRDQGQIRAIEETILPELKRKKEPEKLLRIWSAGASNGEEAYTIAIILDRFFGKASPWKFFIIGTDLNPAAVENANNAIYYDWSFRKIDPQIKADYFTKTAKGYQVNESVRSHAIFRTGNLLKDKFPEKAGGLSDMDLIICRNVFIYFDEKDVSHIVQKFAETLRPGGYLVTGHAELAGNIPGDFETIILPDSVVYRKKDKNSDHPKPMIPGPLKSVNPVKIQKTVAAKKMVNAPGRKSGEKTVKPVPVLMEAKEEARDFFMELKSIFKRGDHASFLDKLEKRELLSPKTEVLLLDMAVRSYCNLGEYNRATEVCEKIISMDSLFPGSYFLLAQISELDKNPERAKELLKKALYLNPGFVEASLELAGIYEAEKDPGKAKKLKSDAIHYLKQLPQDADLEYYEGIRASQLLQTLL